MSIINKPDYLNSISTYMYMSESAGGPQKIIPP